MPYAPVHGGSITMASVGNAVAAACRALQAKLVELASAAASGPFTGPSSDGIEARDGGIGRKGAPYGPLAYAILLKGHKLARLDAEAAPAPGPAHEQSSRSEERRVGKEGG